MKIYVSSAVGQGPTPLAAFDHALIKANIANYNLIRLSSVIPPNSEVVDANESSKLPGEWGDRLYVVYAEMRTNIRGHGAWAGIGWVIDPQDNKGLFVEHEGHSEEEVRNDINNTLTTMIKNRGIEDLKIHMKVIGGSCVEEPICALVAAAYQVSVWEDPALLK